MHDADNLLLAQDSPTQLYDSRNGAGKTTFSKIGKTAGWTYNALGYDAGDNLLYAISTPSGSSKFPAGRLLKIASNGAITDIGALSGDAYLAKHGEIAGAFGTGNVFWVVSSKASQADEISVSGKGKILKRLAHAGRGGLQRADHRRWGRQCHGYLRLRPAAELVRAVG